MKFATLDNTAYILRLERGEQIHASLQQFCAEHSIANAAVSGIGSVENPTLAHYSIERRRFTERAFRGIFEIVSLLGNVGLINNQPTAHLHAVISKATMHTYGGHLVQGACSATLELILHSYPSRHAKIADETIGLNVWNF